MLPRARRSRPSLESLDGRLVPSALPLNAIGGVAQGEVATSGSVGVVSTPIAPSNLTAGRHATLFRVSAGPTPGSPLVPAVVFTLGPDGRPLPFRRGTPDSIARQARAAAYTQDNQPGPLTTTVTGRSGTTGPFDEVTTLPGDVNGDGHVDLNDLKAFVVSFETHRGDAFYKPSADANQNGFIGHGDAKLLLRNLRPLGPEVPLKIDLHLAPGEQVLHSGIKNSGGITRQANVTILGRTTPGSIVFEDAALGNLAFNGKALATDARGNFSDRVQLQNRLTNFTFLAIDPYGQQVVRSFPVRYLI